MSLVDSIKSVQGAVTQAFDQLVSDVEAEEANTGTTGTGTASTSVDKITVTYSDGSSVDFAPTSGEVPANGEKSEQEQPQAPPVDTSPPGNSEQV
jgi:hypothetical protein